MRRLLASFLVLGLGTALACSGPTNLLGSNQGGSLNSPVPAGESIDYEWGSIKILNYHRPTAFQAVKTDLFTGVSDSRPSRATTGAEFVSIELAFSCAEDQTTCDEPPQAILELVLEDGRVVEEEYLPWAETWMGEDEVVGGGTVTGWVIFEVPQNSPAQAFKLTPYEENTAIHMALPELIDGYSIETPWRTLGDGSEERELPALRRDLENAGLEMLWAGLYQAGGETGLYLTVFTDELFFFDDQAAVTEARDALIKALDFWSLYGNGADYLAVELGNDLSKEIIATVGIEAADIESYLAGNVELDAFMGSWWVLQD